MEIIVGKQQLKTFLKRRFTIDELNQIINDARKAISDGVSINHAVYDGIRNLIKSKEFFDIDEYGDDENYWRTYLKYETPLVAYVKSVLGVK